MRCPRLGRWPRPCRWIACPAAPKASSKPITRPLSGSAARKKWMAWKWYGNRLLSRTLASACKGNSAKLKNFSKSHTCSPCKKVPTAKRSRDFSHLTAFKTSKPQGRLYQAYHKHVTIQSWHSRYPGFPFLRPPPCRQSPWLRPRWNPQKRDPSSPPH